MKFEKYNFENFNIKVYNEKSVEIAKDFIDKIIKNDATDGLINRFKQSQDEELVKAVIAKLYQNCYGIILKNEKS